MENFEFLLFLTIPGIGAASGLVYQDDALFLVSDNSAYLYQYQLNDKQLHKIALLENATENTPKKEKLDIEAITYRNNSLHLFGSGSTENRNTSFVYDCHTKEVTPKDFSQLYQNIKTKLHIASEDLNIEGALFLEKDLLFFQRGNGSKATNGIITVKNYLNNLESTDISFTAISLPKIKNVEYTFTDAILAEDKIYFLAAAEDTNSTYEDGEVLGSIIGRIHSKTLQLEKTVSITAKHKLEGLTLWKKNKETLTFLLCEDNDTELQNSSIYKLNINFE